ncbi:LIM and cysteine-rich domains protein 1 [Lampetra fluviatilis]
MELESQMHKMTLSGGPAHQPCMKCQENCSGFELHAWRKACARCWCGPEEHGVDSDVAEDQRLGWLLAGSRHAHMAARRKADAVGGAEGALRYVYKRHRMIITRPLTSRKDPTFESLAYEWVPPGVSQALAVGFMSALPDDKQPVAGTEGERYRQRQLCRQLPPHDRDPSLCHDLSPAEVRAAAEFARRCAAETLAVGTVCRPKDFIAQLQQAQDKDATRDEGKQGDKNSTDQEESSPKEFLCPTCGLSVGVEDPAVLARLGADPLAWHPACFSCSECSELLVDLIYFPHGDRPLCGRHYGEALFPRCPACDELIFSQDCVRLGGRAWHRKHFSCAACDATLPEEPCSVDDGGGRLLCRQCKGSAATGPRLGV